jgi:hypothetical protein
MLTKRWSPIGAMLEQNRNPLKLNREPGTGAVATGIWKATPFESRQNIDESKTQEELFWAILGEAFQRAEERKMLVSIIAQPGWSYEKKIGSLPNWSKEEIEKADRVLWKRTPQCSH